MICRNRDVRLGVTLACVFLLGGVSALGCAFGEIRLDDPFQRKYSLEEATKHYSDFVRWSDFDRASQFVDPEVRDEFLRNAPTFRSLRFTDYEADPVELDEEKVVATIVVRYFAYRLSNPIEIEIRETQEWTRQNVRNTWFVKSTFEGLGADVRGSL